MENNHKLKDDMTHYKIKVKNLARQFLNSLYFTLSWAPAPSIRNIYCVRFYLLLGYGSIGCYKDTGNRAILPLEGKDSILDGAYWTRKNPIEKCAVAAIRAGYSMFAVQHSGWCAASATAPKTFDKYGKSTACGSDGEGGPWANDVYVIRGETARYSVPMYTPHY